VTKGEGEPTTEVHSLENVALCRLSCAATTAAPEKESRMDDLKPKDHAEAVAHFRAQVIGLLAQAEVEHGDLGKELKALSKRRFRVPGAAATRTFSVPTLERWLSAFRKGGADALRPKSRTDRGRGRGLDAAQLKLLLDIRREHPSASARLILRTLTSLGVLPRGQLTATTLRRIYADHGLPRRSRREADVDRIRLRWQAEHPHALWHGDVCHLAPIEIGGVKRPVRVHALLDDCSRDVLTIRAYHSERELDMLDLLVRALRIHGIPDGMYLDNGATYRGDALRVACARLGVTLIHAQPYTPQARGKMERFWRTLREGCTDFIGSVATLHDINVRLWAFVERHYRNSPHAGLYGRTPRAVMEEGIAERPRAALDEERLRDALTVRGRRRLRGDNTLSLNGADYETRLSFLARKPVTIAYCLVDQPIEPWIEHQDQRYPLQRVDAVTNGRTRKRPQKPSDGTIAATAFDPAGTLLDEVRAQIREAARCGEEGDHDHR
jgi:putative transposase